MDNVFASSFFEKEPEFIVGTTEQEGGGAWPTVWAGESASSNSSSSSTDGNNDAFDPFALPPDEEDFEKERIHKPRSINSKVSYYSVSVSSGGVGSGSGSGNSSSQSTSSGSRTCSSNSSAEAGGGVTSTDGGPLGPWRVDLDDSALLNDYSVSTTPSKQPQQQQHGQPQPGATTSSVLHCIVDLDDTALMESDDSEDGDNQQQQNARNENTSNATNASKNHHISCATSSSSPTTTRTTSAASNISTSSAASPIDPWRFDVDLYSTTSSSHHHATATGGGASLDHHYHDQLDDDNVGPSNREHDVHDVYDDDDDIAAPHHHPLNCSSMDPWIEIVSINDESIKGFKEQHQQHQSRPETLPEEFHDEEGRDDSAGNNSSHDDDDDQDDYLAAAAAFQKNLKQQYSPKSSSSRTMGTSRSSTSPVTTSHGSRAAVACVTPSSAAASTPSTGTTTLRQRQPFMINEDSFGFAPFHALAVNVTDGGDQDAGDHGRNGESFREAIVFGLEDDPAPIEPQQRRHNGHRKDDSTSFRSSPPDNVDPFNSLAYENDDDDVDDDDDESTEGSAGFEESTAAQAVDHFPQEGEGVDNDENSNPSPQQEDTTPPSFVKGRGFTQQQQHDENNGDDNDDSGHNDSDEAEETVMVGKVRISDEEEDAFEVTATTGNDKEVVVNVTHHDIATTAAVSLPSVVDDPPLQIVESVDDGDTCLQDQDNEGGGHLNPDDFHDDRLYRPNRSETASSADHGSGSGPASTSYSSWAESNTSSCSSCITSLEQSKHWITVIVAHELWSDDCKVVEMAMGTLHRILLRSILHDPHTDENNNINNTDNSPSRITESMSSNSGSVSLNKFGKANATSKRANTYQRNELIELAFCRGCPLAVIRAMKTHPTNTFLQDSGLCILNVFCWTGVATHVVEVGSLERAMAAIEHFQQLDANRRKNPSRTSKNSAGRGNKEAPEVIESAIYHIANLLRDKTLAARVIEARGLEAIVNAMKRLSAHADVQLAGCCAFRNLLQHQESTILGRQWATKVVQVGAIDRVIAALDDHPGNEKLQLEGYKILRRLSKLNEEPRNNHGYTSQSSDSQDGCHNELLTGCYFRTRNLDAPDLFAPSFEI